MRNIWYNPEDGSCIREEQTDRRFFEGAWVHKRKGVYYLSYSTGDTHLIAYATAASPYGPYTYQGGAARGWLDNPPLHRVWSFLELRSSVPVVRAHGHDLLPTYSGSNTG